MSRTNFKLPYKTFEEGEFRKRIQFMYNGPLKRIKLACAAEVVEAVLDRLPTAVIVGKDKERTLIRAEVYGGKGLDMWLKSQEGSVELLESK